MPRVKVLVTGATGFLAGHCAEELLSHGYAVRGTVRSTSAEVAHLHAAAERTGGSLELVQASLGADDGWADAAKGCDYVWHLASPVPATVPRHEDEVIRPAVEGTLRVLKAAAASGTVRRVIMTSSTDAITHGHPRPGRLLTEADWSRPAGLAPYPKSKLRAEQAAWDFAAGSPVELVTVNPGLVLGPLLRREQKTSMEVVRLLLGRALPAVPRLSFPVVDVRDVATAHRLAMEAPGAAGHRYICAGPALWMGEIAAILAAEFGPRGYRVPTRALPYPLMWLAARFDKTLRLALGFYGVPVLVSAGKAREDLGWVPRPASEPIVAAGESLIRYGIVRRRGAPAAISGPGTSSASSPARAGHPPAGSR
jgi:nucleoside-diphosphate-sugar epimerase